MMEPSRTTIWKWVYRLIRVAGLASLVGYLWLERDWRFSWVGTFGYLAISMLVAWTVVALKLPERFPSLNRYAFYPSGKDEDNNYAKSEREWALKQATYLEGQMRGISMLFSIAEDGLITVPVLMAGISPLSAALGGIVFGVLHLGRFTYIDCVAKAAIYGLVCYFVLPFGVVTVIAGHMMTNVMALAVAKLAKSRLSRSNDVV